MINMINMTTKTLFDGREEALPTDEISLQIGGDVYRTNLSMVKPINQLMQHYRNISADEISASLGFTISKFDDIKIYNGSKRGLKLHFVEAQANGHTLILILSFGEYQPGRMICILEAAIQP